MTRGERWQYSLLVVLLVLRGSLQAGAQQAEQGEEGVGLEATGGWFPVSGPLRGGFACAGGRHRR